MKSSVKTVVTLELSYKELGVLAEWGNYHKANAFAISVREDEILHELQAILKDIENGES